MTDESHAIAAGGDTGHAIQRMSVAPDDEVRLRQALGADPSRNRIATVRVALADDVDTAGHLLDTSVSVRVFLDEDDTEAHAMSIHFPSRSEADSFGRRLLAAGVLSAEMTLFAATSTGAMLAMSWLDSGTAGASQVTAQEVADSGGEKSAVIAGFEKDQGAGDGTRTGGGDQADDPAERVIGPR